LSGNPSGLVRSPIKNLNLNQNLHFLFISSIYLDLCDHVNILRCLKRKWIIDKKGLSWIISLCNLEQSYCQFLEEVQATNMCSSNLRSYLPKILPDSLLKIFVISNPYQGVGPKFLEEKSFSWLSRSKSLFREKSHPFVGYTLNWIFILFLLVFKPSKLLNFLEKGLSFQLVLLSVQENRTVQFQKPDYPIFVGLTPLDITYPFTTSLISLSHSFKNNYEDTPKTSFGDFLAPSWDS
jgi:hypothetical protein